MLWRCAISASKSADIRNLLDAVKFGLQGLQTFAVDLRGVHAGSVVIPNFLFAASVRGHGVLGGVFENLMEDFTVALVDLIADAPARVGGGNGIFRHPSPRWRIG